ncbi:MAG: BTAD domain-containing putative transcriptional regulator [Nocardioidaceae bacterium]
MAPASDPVKPRAEVWLLGPLDVRVGGVEIAITAAQQRLVLVALALAGGSPVSAGMLCDILWPERVPNTARTSLHNTIRRLRTLFAKAGVGEVIRTGPEGYGFDIESDAVDAIAFSRLLVRARSKAESGDADAALALYDQALRLWRGDPVPDLVNAGWLAGPVAQLVEQRVVATEEWADLERAAGRPERALERLAPLSEEWPLRESVRARLMLALRAAGRTADALEEYLAARRLLVAELGVEPGPVLRQAHAAVLRLDDADVASPPTAAVRPAQLPALPAKVVGREAELALLDLSYAGSGLAEPADSIGGAAVAPSGNPVVCVLSGPAGVGKSTLAAQWAQRVAESFPDGQLWVNLRGFDSQGSPLAPGQVLSRFLAALGVATDEIPVDADLAADLYRSLLAERRVLVVLDNAREAEQVRPLLPTGPGSLAVVTSRHDLSSLAVTHGAQLITLSVLAPGAATELLADRLGPDRLAAEPEAIGEIVGRCGGLPLALALVAARVAARADLSMTAMADQLRENSSLDVLNVGDTTTDLRAVLSWSVDAVSPGAARALALVGLHPGPEIGVPALASLAGTTIRQARVELDELARAHLVTEPGPARFAMHDLVRDYARELFEASGSTVERLDALRRLADHYLHAAYAATRTLFSTPLPLTLSPPAAGVAPETFAGADDGAAWLQAELPALLRVVDLIAGVPGLEAHPWQIARVASGYLWGRCAWADMAQLHEQALAACLRAADREGEADTRHGLGDAYAGLERWQDSRTELDHALELYRALGDPVGEGDVLCTLGRLMEMREEYAEGLRFTRQSLDVYRRIGDRSGEAVSLNNLGWLHAMLGEFADALACAQEALEIYREEGDLAGQSYALDSMGRTYAGLGDLPRAIELYAEAIDLAGSLGESFNQAMSLTHLGDAHHAAGDLASARRSWSAALATYEELEHPRAEALRSRLAAPLSSPGSVLAAR